MSSDSQAHIDSQQAITHPMLSSSPSAKTTTGFMRPANESAHASTTSLTVGSSPTPPLPQAHHLPQASSPPQPAAKPPSATSSSPHPGNAVSAVQSQPTPSSSGAKNSFNQPIPSPPVPQITTVSLPMSMPTPGYHNPGGQQQPEQFTSSPHPISPSSAHTQGPFDATATGADTSSVRSTTSISLPAHQAHTPATTVPASAPTPGPVTATPILPSSSPNAPIVASIQAQRHFHDSGSGTAGSAFASPSRKPTQESIQESAKEYEDDVRRRHADVPAQALTQAHGYEHASTPVAGPSGQTNAAAQTQSRRTTATPPPPQEHPSYVPADARSPAVHTNVGYDGNAAGIGAGYTNGAGNVYNTPAPGTRHGQRAQNQSPGRRTSTRTVSYTEPPLPSRALDRYPLPMTNPNQPVPSASVAKGLPLPPLAHHGSGSGDLVMSPQPDATAMNRSELDWAVPYVPGSSPAGHGNGLGMQGMPGGMASATGGRPGSRHESRRGSAYVGNGGGNGNGGTPGAHRRSMSMAATLVTGSGERSIDERLQPTLEAAERELVRARRAGACFRAGQEQVQGWC